MRAKILFERHKFSRATSGRFDETHPGISNPVQGGYGAGGAHQYDRLAEAILLDREAALEGASAKFSDRILKSRASRMSRT